MFLHIGNNNIVNTKDIIGIYQIDSIQETKEYQEIIERLKRSHQLLICCEESEKKTFILTKEENTEKGYFSNISSVTLAKRARTEKNIL